MKILATIKVKYARRVNMPLAIIELDNSST